MLVITRKIGTPILIRDSLGNEMVITIRKCGSQKVVLQIEAAKEYFQVIKPEEKSSE